MALLDLPPELLTLIARHLSQAEGRLDVDDLLLSKQWYQAALPIYLSDLQLSDIYLSSHSLLRFPSPHTILGHEIINTVERLSIRLNGHPSNQTARHPWHGSDTRCYDDETDADLKDQVSRRCWMTVGPVEATLSGRKPNYEWHTEEHQLRPWRKHINEKLLALAEVLPLCQPLEEFSFEASSEDDPRFGPRWDYLLGSSIANVIKALPPGLKRLTLDTCGSTLRLSEEDRAPMHFCPLLALRLPELEQVRIRMRHTCPEILSTPDSTSATPSRLRSLIIRLSRPFFPEAKYEKHNGYTEYDTEVCPSYTKGLPNGQAGLARAMISTGVAFAKELKLEKMRVTYRPSEFSGINLTVADCVRERFLYDPCENFSYEDDGRAWDPWEEDDEQLRDETGF